MRRFRLNFPFYARLVLRLLMLTTLLIGVFILAGHGIPRQAIAFLNLAEFNQQLDLMDIRRRIVVTVSDVPMNACCLIWSPDGTKIAFENHNDRTFVLDIYSGAMLSPPDGLSGTVMGWSADGKRLIVGSAISIDGSQFSLDPEGYSRLPLTESVRDRFYLYFAPSDGRFVWYGEWQANRVDYKIYRMNIETRISHLLLDSNEGVTATSISENDQRIAFSINQGNEIVVMNADGSDPQQWTPAEGEVSAIVWSPDGRRLLLVSQDDTFLRHLYVADFDGQNQRLLNPALLGMDVSKVVWSPDGTRILLSGYAGTGGFEFYLLDADGANLQQLTVSPETDVYPAWQPVTQ